MISQRQLREMIRNDPRYSDLADGFMDHVIAKIRQRRLGIALWNKSLNDAPGGRNAQDSEYEKCRYADGN